MPYSSNSPTHLVFFFYKIQAFYTKIPSISMIHIPNPIAVLFNAVTLTLTIAPATGCQKYIQMENFPIY